jgi:hypothetical protein
VNTSEQEIAAIANKSGMSMVDVQSTLSAIANKSGKSVSVDPNISSSVANLDVDPTSVSVTAPSTTAPATATSTAPSTSTSISPAIDRGLALAAAQQAVSDTISNMGPLSSGPGGQVAAIAEEFGLSPSEVAAMAGPSVSSSGIAAAPSVAPAAPAAPSAPSQSTAPSMTDENDPNSAINQDRAQYNPNSLAQQQSTTVNDVIDQIQTAMQNLDRTPNLAETIVGTILSPLATPQGLADRRADAAQAALDGYKSGEGMGDYGVPDFGGDQAGEGPDRSCPEGYIFDPATNQCVLIGSTSTDSGAGAGAGVVEGVVEGDGSAASADGVGAINIPRRPVESFEDVLARISSGAPTIAPLGQPLQMAYGGVVESEPFPYRYSYFDSWRNSRGPSLGSDSVVGLNMPTRPVESFEDVMLRISSSPTIAPLSRPVNMQAGGAVGLNRAADSFLKALAG